MLFGGVFGGFLGCFFLGGGGVIVGVVAARVWRWWGRGVKGGGGRERGCFLKIFDVGQTRK